MGTIPGRETTGTITPRWEKTWHKNTEEDCYALVPDRQKKTGTGNTTRLVAPVKNNGFNPQK